MRIWTVIIRLSSICSRVFPRYETSDQLYIENRSAPGFAARQPLRHEGNDGFLPGKQR